MKMQRYRVCWTIERKDVGHPSGLSWPDKTIRAGAIVVMNKDLSAKAVALNKLAVHLLGEIIPDYQYLPMSALEAI